MNDFKLCQDNTRLLPEHSEDESSGSFTPGSSSEWEDEESEDDIRLGYYYLPGLPPPHRAPPMQLSSRVPMVKGKAKSITIDKGEKKKADEVSTIFEIYKPPLDARQPLPETITQIGLQTEKILSTSSAAILREEVQRLAAANPSIVSTMQPKATKQLVKRGIGGGAKPQSVLANPAPEKAPSVKMAQTTTTQTKQTNTAAQMKQTQPATQTKQTQPATQTKQTQPAIQMKQTQPAIQMKQTQPATQMKQRQTATQTKQTQTTTQMKQPQTATQLKQTQPATQLKQTQTATQTKQTQTATQTKQTQTATQTKQTQTATQTKQTQTATQTRQTQTATQMKQTQTATQTKQTQTATQMKQAHPATQMNQTQPANRSLDPQFKPESTGTSTISAAPAAANTPLGNQPNQQPTPAPQVQAPAPPPMWLFTGRSGGPPTPNPPPKTQHSQQSIAPIPATSNGGQSSGSNYTDDEFLHNYATYRYGNMDAMTDYIERSLLHSCNRRECIQPGIQADGTFKFYRPPPTLTFQRPYGPGLAEGVAPRRRRQEGRKIKEFYYDQEMD